MVDALIDPLQSFGLSLGKRFGWRTGGEASPNIESQ
jgi:hypothetical protein